VVVTDRKGNVIHGLTRQDFHVTEAGELQTITSFEESDVDLPLPTANINSTADLDRRAPNAPVNIILLDEFNTRFEDMAFARYSLKKFLNAQPTNLTLPTELVAVSLGHFTVLHDYTQDKKALLDALNHHFAVYPWQVHNGGWIAERYAQAFESLRSVALATEGHPGHKNMIWIGRGFPALAVDNLDSEAQASIENIVANAVDTLRDARITLYTIDPANLTDPGKYGGSAVIGDADSGYTSIDADPFGGNFEFGRLATATGGQNLYGRNDVDAQIGTAARDGANFYTIAYHPTRDSTGGVKFRRIKVTLDRPGLTAATREGYYPVGPLPQEPPKGQHTVADARLVRDLVTADGTSMVYDGVRMVVTPDAQAGAYRIHISPQSLHWLTEGNRTYVDFILIVSTFDSKGKELERRARRIRILSEKPELSASQGIEMVYRFTPDTKAARVHFVVRISDTDRIGSQDLLLTPTLGSGKKTGCKVPGSAPCSQP
jgi:VWFA-related protein